LKKTDAAKLNEFFDDFRDQSIFSTNWVHYKEGSYNLQSGFSDTQYVPEPYSYYLGVPFSTNVGAGCYNQISNTTNLAAGTYLSDLFVYDTYVSTASPKYLYKKVI